MKYYKYNDTDSFSLVTVGNNKYSLRYYDIFCGPKSFTKDIDNIEEINEWVSQFIEIENGEKLCKDFDALEDSYKHMIDLYDKMFKKVLE